MATKWRLLIHEAASAYENMAIDEAILRHVTSGRVPNTLRFYTWTPSAVSIGYFQGIDQEVDLEACRQMGVDVIRRQTGGGAVYHDRDGEVTYSLTLPQHYPGVPGKVLDSYGVLCAGLVIGLHQLGIEAAFSPINDIVVNGKKISGNAQTRSLGGILQHGTILCDVNPQVMFSLLKVPNEKMRDKLIQNVTERVTSIRREIGHVDKEALISALMKGFSQALDFELESGVLLDSECALASELERDKYASHAWNTKR